MGYPLWFGRVKRRVAKKYLQRPIWRDKRFLHAMADVAPGDLIHDCSSFNVRSTHFKPRYRRVGRGYVLVDIDITNTLGGGCSFVHCGVEPAWPRSHIIRYWETRLPLWRANGDEWDFAKRYEFTSVDEEGKAIFDRSGYEAKYERSRSQST